MSKAELILWIAELQRRHDKTKEEMVHEDDYQLGYLHGLTSAIAYLEERFKDDN